MSSFISQKSVTVAVTPTVTAGAYAALDVIGGLLTFAGAVRPASSSGTLMSVTVTDKAAQGANLRLVLFNASVSSGVTNDAAFDPTDADLADKIIGIVDVDNHVAFTDNGVSYKNGIGLTFSLAQDSATLYGVLVAVGTPTYASTSDITVKLGIAQD